MHLAAISNDPMGEMDAAATYAVNRDASVRIAQLAKKAGVPRYLFAASCSVYGAGQKLDLTRMIRLIHSPPQSKIELSRRSPTR
jgi:nucleoside-diphosphate-sugar epimerase